MSNQLNRIKPIEVISHTSQTDYQRVVMMMMQLDMALAMAREKNLADVEEYLEEALAKARERRNKLMQ